MARLIYTLISFLVMTSIACSGAPKRGATKIEREPIRATSPEAQSQFDAAVAELERGEYDTASESLRLLQAEHATDPISQVAELYVARATLGDWKNAPGALAIFSGLARSEDVDPRIRYAAMMYEAATHAATGDRDKAFATLADYPSSSLSPSILTRDRAAAWSLLIEARVNAKRFADVLYVSGAAWDDGDDKTVRAFARQRAFEAAPNLVENEMTALSTDPESVLVRAAAGWALISSQSPLADTSPDLLNALARDLAIVGDSERANQLANRRQAESPSGPIRIGVVVPMSGSHSRVGESALRGALVAAGSLDETENSRISVVVIDAATPDEEIFARLSAADAIGFVGPLDVARAASLADMATKKRIPMVALTTRMPDLRETDDGQPWVFRNFIDADAEASAVATAAWRDAGSRRVAIVRPNISYGSRMSDTFKNAFEGLGGTTEVFEYDRKSTDFTKVAARVAKWKPDAVFIPDAGTKVAELSAFLAASNIWGIGHERRPDPRSKRIQVHYLGTSLWQAPMLAEQAGSYVVGALIPVWSSQSLKGGHEFGARFETAYGAPPSDLEAFMYDSVDALIESAQLRGGTTPDSLREVLLSGEFDGATGMFSFAPTGESQRDVRFISVVAPDGERPRFQALKLVVEHQSTTKAVDPAL